MRLQSNKLRRTFPKENLDNKINKIFCSFFTVLVQE